MRALFFALTVCVFAGCPPVDPCGAPGERTVTITSSGLPDGTDGIVHVNGQTVTNSGTVTLSSGQLALSADTALVSSARPVRGAYLPTFTPDEQCVAPDAGLPIAANWLAIPTSGSLWVLNQNATAQVLGFPAAQLTSGDRDAMISTLTDLGQFTFDKQGNVWAVQGTLASSALNFYPASSFTGTGARTPTVKLGVSTLSGCTRGAVSLAFDAQGNLWLASDCDGKVFKLSKDALGASATVNPLATLTVPSPGGLAFDASGNLFVASRADGRVHRFDAAQLNADASEPAAKIGARASTDGADTTLYSASWLAFDSHGALWFNDFGSNTFVSISAANLNGTGLVDVQPAVRLVVAVDVVLENFAFDEQGGLWSPGAQGKIIRFSADDLSGSGTTSPERVILSSDIGSANSVVIYPAPAGLPLFHSLP